MEQEETEISTNESIPGITGSVINVSKQLPGTELNIVDLHNNIIIQLDEPTEKQKEKGITTEIFAIEPSKGLGLNKSTITLRKTGNVSSILYCPKWDINKFSCKKNWTNSEIEFLDNGTYISFNVTSFSAYAGGQLMNLNITNITNITSNNQLTKKNDQEKNSTSISQCL